MAEYLLMGDIHLSDRAPSSCTDSYQDDILTILAEVGHIARERRSTAVIWAGDIFHHKTPGRTSHRSVLDLINVATGYPCPVYVVPGNHDMLYDRLESIHLTQPLGVVIASGAVQLLDGWMDDGNRYVFGLPWLQHWTDDTVSAALEDYRTDGTNDDPMLVVTHAPLYPPGQELVHEYYPAEKWAAAMGNRGSVYYGHVHEPHGWYRTGGVTFCNVGAISRGSLHEHNLTRKVQIAAWNSETGFFDLLDVPHKPAAEVFRLQEADEVRTARVDLGQFLDSVGSAHLDIASIEAVKDHVRTLNLGPNLERVIFELLEDATP
jgi:predicted phosphodiesterase